MGCTGLALYRAQPQAQQALEQAKQQHNTMTSEPQGPE